MARLVVILLGLAAALAAAVAGRGLAGRLKGGGSKDPTIARPPEPRMPVTPQATAPPDDDVSG